jgi:peptidylprolyl isomerase
MKQAVLILLMAASAAASAQTPAKPAAPAASAPKPATTASKPATTAPKPAAPAARSATASSAVKLPPGVPPAKGIVKTAFSLRYQDVVIGTGADAEPGKLYKVQYTGWRAADGVKFDSSYDHRPPLKDKDGKPVLGDDGKPKLGDPQPYQFPQGMGGAGRGGPFPGFDQGFEGMKVGGKRRLFIPYELAYGTHAIPDRDADHPGIPAKSDLIFDIELIDVTDLPTPPNHPGMGGMPGGRPMPPTHPTPGAPGTPGAPAAPASPATPPAPTAPAAAPAAAAPAPPAAAPATPSAQPQAK